MNRKMDAQVTSDLLKRLTDLDVETRARDAEDLGDLLEYGERSEAEVRKTADALIEAACGETDPGVREALLNSLAILGSRFIGVNAAWDRLAPLLGTLDPSSLENALSALGFSRNPTFVDVLGTYRTDPNPTIRTAAENALRELNGGTTVRKD